MRRFAALWVSLVSWAGVVGCQEADLAANREAFAVVPFPSDILKRHFESILRDPVVPVCVANMDAAGKYAITEGMWENWVRDALDQWFFALQSTTIGKQIVTTPVSRRLSFRHTDTPCDSAYTESSKTISIQFFPSVREAEPYFCNQMKNNVYAQAGFSCGSDLQYSSGEQLTRTILILPVAGDRARPVSKFGSTLTHEFGHLFGLFDAYKMPPRVDFEGPSPQAVMAYTSDRVTQDDAAGIDVAMTWAYTGKIDCGSHTPVKNKGYYPKILYCQMKPTKDAGKSHQEYFERLRRQEPEGLVPSKSGG